jgi:hypothetical protein
MKGVELGQLHAERDHEFLKQNGVKNGIRMCFIE